MKKVKKQSKRRRGGSVSKSKPRRMGLADFVTPTTMVTTGEQGPRPAPRRMRLSEPQPRGEARRVGLAEFVTPTTRVPMDGRGSRPEPRRMRLSDPQPRGEVRRMGISDFRPPASKKSTAQISREIRDFLDED